MKKILVVVDAQNDFVTGCLGSDEAKKVLPNIVEKINSLEDGVSVCYTLDTHFDEASNDPYFKTLEGKKLPIVHCIQGTNGWQLCPEVKQAIDAFESRSKHNIVSEFEKHTFGSLWMSSYIPTTLNYGESDWEPVKIEVVGYCTDICVISNALLLRAFMPNAEIVIDSKCCAGTSKEAHEAALLVAKSCQIDVI